jgi:hypothetical protein
MAPLTPSNYAGSPRFDLEYKYKIINENENGITLGVDKEEPSRCYNLDNPVLLLVLKIEGRPGVVDEEDPDLDILMTGTWRGALARQCLGCDLIVEVVVEKHMHHHDLNDHNGHKSRRYTTC